MLRNKSLSALQKTYDDSYLSCSTAVYYESQGDEPEATRHWRTALGQIYEYNATKAPPAYAPQTDTEKALQGALKELELQCKERIDLLEALRASRQDNPVAQTASSNKLTKAPDLLAPDLPPRAQSGIGLGTIPPVTYSELSRPTLPHRPTPPPRMTAEFNSIAGSSSSVPMLSPGWGANLQQSVSAGSSPKATAPIQPPPYSEKNARSPSPEKHTMRTTLRSGKSGEKPYKPPRKPAKPPGEGSNKAATLAWSALGSRGRQVSAGSLDNKATASTSKTRQPQEAPRRNGSAQAQWDSRSRRLVSPRDTDSAASETLSPSIPRHSDEYPYSRPSLLSVSAASSAINSSSFQELPTMDVPVSHRAAQTQVLSPKSVGLELNGTDSGTTEDSVETGDSKKQYNASKQRQHPAKRAEKAPERPQQDKERANRSRRRVRQPARPQATPSTSEDDVALPSKKATPRKREEVLNGTKSAAAETSLQSSDDDDGTDDGVDAAWKKKKAAILNNLPPGVDEAAAKQILNDIIVQGDEVRWGDIAGLEVAKNALRETVVYPFLRPDLFMGLREPARGMLLFGPPGTGKTMLARAVATESKSTFFSISASSLTSKFLGESEKLVRALFGLARALAPSIIFVDEIDSLLSQRSGSGEHEATRRIKTEFLIQWSDLQRAAAGRETTERDKERGDANRVLVLAATNLPWAIDEAARRRFVRRQYIPLPELKTRETQLGTLLGQQKHDLSVDDIDRLVQLTDGFSGSDITALAKDAAMGPLRSLGEALLHMTMDEIRPIRLEDFEASLGNIRPSVSKAGLQEYEDWAREFGERGG